MRIAVFGSKGYLGSQLVYFFHDKRVRVDEFDLPEFDATSARAWESFDPSIYESILFFVGLTGTEASFSNAETFLTVNECGLLGLLNRLAPLGENAPYVVFPSTRLVYRGADCPLNEDAPKEAKTVYAANKLSCEALLQAYGTRFGLKYSVVRICVPYGSVKAHDYSYGTVGLFLKQAKSGTIKLFGGGEVRRTFTHVVDICRAINGLTLGHYVGTFNVGGCDLSLFEAATIIARRTSARIESVEWPELARRIESGSTVFDSGKLDAIISMQPYRTFEVGGF